MCVYGNVHIKLCVLLCFHYTKIIQHMEKDKVIESLLHQNLQSSDPMYYSYEEQCFQ